MTRSFMVRVLAGPEAGGQLVARVQAVESDDEYLVHSVEELAGVLIGATPAPTSEEQS